MTRTPFMLSLVAASLMMGACKKDPEPMAKQPAEPMVEDGELTLPIPPDPSMYAPDPMDQVVENLQRVGFEFDSSQLTAASRRNLDRTAEILVEHPQVRLTIQGHADERGTTDYNLALGMDRAAAVVDYLTAQGVDGDRLFQVSYGEEKPLLDTHNQLAWSTNRRVEFVVTADPDGVVDGTLDNPALGGAQLEMRGASPRE